jgi:hypothetical protein
MADENISKEYVYDSETEELVVLESNWYQDYSKPPIVNRKWVDEGEAYITTPRNAKVLLENCLVIRKGQQKPKVPDGLNWSMAAILMAKQVGFDPEKDSIKGTGRLGKVTVSDVTHTFQEGIDTASQSAIRTM